VSCCNPTLPPLFTSFHFVASPPFLTFSQAEAVRLELRGNRPRGYMQMDGEPWKQPLGRVDEPATLVEINKLSTPTILLKRWSFWFSQVSYLIECVCVCVSTNIHIWWKMEPGLGLSYELLPFTIICIWYRTNQCLPCIV
jgi:hypothetical protein